MRHIGFLKRAVCVVLVCVFAAGSVVPARGSDLLPPAGQMVRFSPAYRAPELVGIRVYANEPFRFDFIVDKGDFSKSTVSHHPSAVDDVRLTDRLKSESSRLIKYFLASLTIPEKDLWVNLSPEEKDRIVPDAFGQTEMGRDLVAQDYLLKQVSSSALNPDEALGQRFWDEVYRQAREKFGTSDIPLDTRHRVWIVPSGVTVYEKTSSTPGVGKVSAAALVVNAKLKVMLETDYLALDRVQAQQGQRVAPDSGAPKGEAQDLAKQVLREVVIPALEKEVNEGEHFAPLRQIYHSFILAAWYKKKLQNSIMSALYMDKNKVAGVDTRDPQAPQRIYEQYVESFKKGAFNFIREERDEAGGALIPRKYFSGGIRLESAMEIKTDDGQGEKFLQEHKPQDLHTVSAGFAPAGQPDEAQVLQAAYWNTARSLKDDVEGQKEIAAWRDAHFRYHEISNLFFGIQAHVKNLVSKTAGSRQKRFRDIRGRLEEYAVWFYAFQRSRATADLAAYHGFFIRSYDDLVDVISSLEAIAVDDPLTRIEVAGFDAFLRMLGRAREKRLAGLLKADYFSEVALQEVGQSQWEEILHQVLGAGHVPEFIKVDPDIQVPVFVRADPDRFEHVLLNLIKNACEAIENARKAGAATPQGGWNIKVTIHQTGSGTEIKVQDNGPGIEPSLLPRVFDRYATTKEHSTGDGLAIVRTIVERHPGGIIRAESNPGQGAAFTIRLPAEAAMTGLMSAASGPGEQDGAVRPLIQNEHVYAYHQIERAVLAKEIPPGLPVILIDQHSDSDAVTRGRGPESWNWMSHAKRDGLIGKSLWAYPQGRSIFEGNEEGVFRAQGSDFEALIRANKEYLKDGVILSVDMDYFASNPVMGEMGYVPRAGEIGTLLRDMILILQEQGIKVRLFNGAYSAPKYAPEEWKSEFTEAMNEVAERRVVFEPFTSSGSPAMMAERVGKMERLLNPENVSDQIVTINLERATRTTDEEEWEFLEDARMAQDFLEGRILKLDLSHRLGIRDYRVLAFQLHALAEFLARQVPMAPQNFKEVYSAIFEIIKNACFHGNQLRGDLPVYIQFDPKDQGLKVYDLANPDKIVVDSELWIKSDPFLHGKNRAVDDIKEKAGFLSYESPMPVTMDSVPIGSVVSIRLDKVFDVPLSGQRPSMVIAQGIPDRKAMVFSIDPKAFAAGNLEAWSEGLISDFKVMREGLSREGSRDVEREITGIVYFEPQFHVVLAPLVVGGEIKNTYPDLSKSQGRDRRDGVKFSFTFSEEGEPQKFFIAQDGRRDMDSRMKRDQIILTARLMATILKNIQDVYFSKARLFAVVVSELDDDDKVRAGQNSYTELDLEKLAYLERDIQSDPFSRHKEKAMAPSGTSGAVAGTMEQAMTADQQAALEKLNLLMIDVSKAAEELNVSPVGRGESLFHNVVDLVSQPVWGVQGQIEIAVDNQDTGAERWRKIRSGLLLARERADLFWKEPGDMARWAGQVEDLIARQEKNEARAAWMQGKFREFLATFKARDWLDAGFWQAVSRAGDVFDRTWPGIVEAFNAVRPSDVAPLGDTTAQKAMKQVRRSYDIILKKRGAETWETRRVEDGRRFRFQARDVTHAGAGSRTDLSRQFEKLFRQIFPRLAAEHLRYEKNFAGNPERVNVLLFAGEEPVGFYSYYPPDRFLIGIGVVGAYRGTGAADVLFEDMKERIFNGKEGVLSAEIARAGLPQDIFHGTLQSLKKALNIRSVLVHPRPGKDRAMQQVFKTTDPLAYEAGKPYAFAVKMSRVDEILNGTANDDYYSLSVIGDGNLETYLDQNLGLVFDLKDDDILLALRQMGKGIGTYGKKDQLAAFIDEHRTQEAQVRTHVDAGFRNVIFDRSSGEPLGVTTDDLLKGDHTERFRYASNNELIVRNGPSLKNPRGAVMIVRKGAYLKDLVEHPDLERALQKNLPVVMLAENGADLEGARNLFLERFAGMALREIRPNVFQFSAGSTRESFVSADQEVMAFSNSIRPLWQRLKRQDLWRRTLAGRLSRLVPRSGDDDAAAIAALQRAWTRKASPVAQSSAFLMEDGFVSAGNSADFTDAWTAFQAEHPEFPLDGVAFNLFIASEKMIENIGQHAPGSLSALVMRYDRKRDVVQLAALDTGAQGFPVDEQGDLHVAIASDDLRMAQDKASSGFGQAMGILNRFGDRMAIISHGQRVRADLKGARPQVLQPTPLSDFEGLPGALVVYEFQRTRLMDRAIMLKASVEKERAMKTTSEHLDMNAIKSSVLSYRLGTCLANSTMLIHIFRRLGLDATLMGRFRPDESHASPIHYFVRIGRGDTTEDVDVRPYDDENAEGQLLDAPADPRDMERVDLGPYHARLEESVQKGEYISASLVESQGIKMQSSQGLGEVDDISLKMRNELNHVAEAAVSVVRKIHDGNFEFVMMSGTSSSLSELLFREGWKSLYPQEDMPQIYRFSTSDENVLLYYDTVDIDESWDESERSRRTEAVLEQRIGTADLASVKAKRGVFLDDRVRRGRKFAQLKNRMNRHGFKDFSVAAFSMVDKQARPMMNAIAPGLFEKVIVGSSDAGVWAQIGKFEIYAKILLDMGQELTLSFLKDPGNIEEGPYLLQRQELREVIRQVNAKADPSIKQDSPLGNAKAGNTPAGGIDLGAGTMDMKTTSSGGEFQFNVRPEELKAYEGAPGLMPVIFDIRPLDSLPRFLGQESSAPSAGIV